MQNKDAAHYRAGYNRAAMHLETKIFKKRFFFFLYESVRVCLFMHAQEKENEGKNIQEIFTFFIKNLNLY